MSRPLAIKPPGVALVAGGGGATGAALAALMARRGLHVVIGDRDIARAQAVAGGCGGLATGLDVTDPAMWDNALAVAEGLPGGLRVLAVLARPAGHGDDETDNPRQVAAWFETLVSGPAQGIARTRALWGGRTGAVLARTGPAAWMPEQGNAARAAAEHALRAWLLSEAPRARRQGVMMTLVGSGPFKAGLPSVRPDEVAAAGLWALERGRHLMMAPEGWDAWRWRVRGALADSGLAPSLPPVTPSPPGARRLPWLS